MNYLCYMNSMYSNLSNFSKNIIDFKNPSRLIKETQGLFENFKKGDKQLNGREIILSVIDDRYKYNNEEDANEFISTFLNIISEETKEYLNEKPKIDINEYD